MEEHVGMVGQAFHPKRRINKKTKLNLVFDPTARRDFLTGFSKRKRHRQKRAQDELKEQIQEERRKLRQDARDTYKKLVVSHRAIPEVEKLLTQEHDLENHSVTITELSTNDLAEKNNWIGANKVQYEEVKEEPEEEEKEELPGMELKAKKRVEKEETPIELKTKKDIKKIIKKQATKTVQKSKAFQTQGKIQQRKQRKASSKLKGQRLKIRSKSKKGIKGHMQQ